MVLDSCATSYIGWPPPAFHSPPEFLRPFGSKRQSRAGGVRGGLSARFLFPLISDAKVQHFSCDSKYQAP